MNFTGKSGSTANGPFSGGHGYLVDEFSHRGHGDAITVSDPDLLFSGDYKRSGPDLILSKDGREQVIENYFVGEKRAALAAPDGAQLSGGIVSALTGHVQYAQASGAADAGKVIGHVTKLAGNATVIRNGVSIVLNMGDNVHKGDVVQSGSNSSLGITFIDGTVFGLASNARMVLNDMVYDPNGSSNSSFLSLVQGTITFVAGQTAKHGDMKIDTPVATMGIRGTAVLVEIGFDVPVFDPANPAARSVPVKFQVLQERDGTVGSYFLYDKNDLTYSNPIATINRAGEVTAFNANGQITVSQVTQIAPEVKAIIDQTLLLYNPNPQSNPVPGSTPADPVTPGTPGGTTPLRDVPVGTPTPLQVPINFPDPGRPGQIIQETANLTFTVLKKIDVTPVVDKASFTIADQVKIDDSNPSDVLIPYVAGSGRVLSVTGPAYAPAGIDLKNFVTVDAATGHVSYDLARFAFLKAGDKAIVTIEFDSSAGSTSFHESLTVTISGANDAPAIERATIVIAQGGTVVLTAANIAVIDPDNTNVTFTVSQVTHGKFQTTADGINWSDATTFTTTGLNAGHVRFVHDGGEAAPTFSIQADDGEPLDHQGATAAGTVDFTNLNDAPVVTNAAISLTEGGTIVLTAANIAVSDPDSASFTFTVSNVAHGRFQTMTDNVTWTDATSFTTADLNAGHVRFVHDGGEAAPTWSIQADDGGTVNNLSNVLDGLVDFIRVNDAPSITGAALAVSEGGTVVLSPADIGVSDPDSASFVFSVSNVSHGAFQTTTDGVTWVGAAAFTTDELNAGHVRFVHDGSEDAPTFSVQAYDGGDGNSQSSVVAGSVAFSNVNDAPAGSDHTVTTREDTAYTFAVSDFGFSDPNDRVPDSLHAVRIVSVSGGGNLEYNGNAVTAGQSISADDIAAGLLKFVPAAGATQASFTFQVQDDGGTAGGGVDLDQSPNTFAFDITPVNHAPVAVPDTGISISENGGVEVSFSPIGNAAAGTSGEYIITPAIDNQAGALWSDSKVNLNTSFTVSAELFFGATDGADGFTFIIQNQSKTVIGNSGGGLGYEGIANSVAIEFDTWDNGSGFNDMADDHAAFDIDGSMSGLGGPVDLGDIEDGQYHPVTISWDAASHVLTLTYEGVVVGSRTIDIAATVGGDEAYIGFAGSTGAANNLQKIRDLSYQSADSSVVLDVLANDTDADPGDKATLHVVAASTGSGASVTFTGLAGAGIVYSPGHVFDYLAAGQTAADTINYTIADSHGAQSISTAEVTIVGINDAPSIDGSDSRSVSVAENSTAVATIVAHDPDSPSASLTYSILAGPGSPDASKFTIDSTTGALSFVHAPDFGNPTDAGHDNTYTVEVNVSDGALSDVQTLFVHVTDVNDNAPVITTAPSQSVAENHSFVTHLSAFDVDSVGGPTVFSIAEGLDGSLFEIVDGNLRFRVAPDFEHPLDSNHNNVYDVTVNAFDGLNRSTRTISVHVTNVNESPQAFDDIVITNNGGNSSYVIPDWALLANDTDPDSSALTVGAISHSSGFFSAFLSHGDVSIHDNSFVGGSFIYTVSDGSLTDTGNVTVTQDPGTMNGGSSGEIFIGDSSGTTINANGGNDILIGNGGDDILNGGPGNDTYVFGLHDGHDVINDTSGLDTIRIEAGGAALAGLNLAENTAHDLVIQFNGQQVTVDDHFIGSDNVGGLQFDGGASYDGYRLGSDLYFLSNDGGSNRNGAAGNDVLSGDGAANAISGGDGNDLLFGNAGNDTLNGGSGNDLLVGGAGNDFMTGGSGNDQFVFAAGFGKDIIADFQSGHDKIDLFAVVSTNNVDGWIHSHVAASPTSSTDTLITIDAFDSITLHNVVASSLHASDFIVHPVT